MTQKIIGCATKVQMLDTVGCLAGIKSVLHKRKVFGH